MEPDRISLDRMEQAPARLESRSALARASIFSLVSFPLLGSHSQLEKEEFLGRMVNHGDFIH